MWISQACGNGLAVSFPPGRNQLGESPSLSRKRMTCRPTFPPLVEQLFPTRATSTKAGTPIDRSRVLVERTAASQTTGPLYWLERRSAPTQRALAGIQHTLSIARWFRKSRFARSCLFHFSKELVTGTLWPLSQSASGRSRWPSRGLPRKIAIVGSPLIHEPDLLATDAELPSIPRRLIDLEIMHLAFLAAGRDGHAYASAGVGAAGGPVPAFLIGVDQIAIFPMHHALA